MCVCVCVCVCVTFGREKSGVIEQEPFLFDENTFLPQCKLLYIFTMTTP